MKKRMPALLALVLCGACLFSFASCGSEADGDVPGQYLSEKGDSASGILADVAEGNTVSETARKIVKTYTVSAETKDFDGANDSLSALIESAGGYVEKSSVRGGNAYYSSNARIARTAEYTVRIPAEGADAFVGSMDELLHVTSSTSTVDDISETYYTADARLQELIAERDSLLQMMQSLNSTEDYGFWLTLQERISDVRQEIAVLQAKIKTMDGQVSYSTVTLTLHEVLEYTEVEKENFFTRFGEAFVTGWSDFFDGVLDFLVWFAEAIPGLLLLTGIGFAIAAIVKKVRKKKREKRAKYDAKMNQSGEDSMNQSGEEPKRQ